jgi:hypothetical protein
MYVSFLSQLKIQALARSVEVRPVVIDVATLSRRPHGNLTTMDGWPNWPKSIGHRLEFLEFDPQKIEACSTPLINSLITIIIIKCIAIRPLKNSPILVNM